MVYPPTTSTPSSIASAAATAAAGSSSSLYLRYVHGYDGDITKHGGAVRGKNVVCLNYGRLAYPAAALVVLLHLESNTQAFFSGAFPRVICYLLDAVECVGYDGELQQSKY